MEPKDFFEFDSKLSSSTIQAHLTNLEVNELKLIKGEYEGINFPLTFKQEYGKKLQDILNTGYASLYLISSRMKTLLEENNLTGWKSFPIQIFKKNGEEITGYHGFSITGRCASTSFEKSEIIEKQFVPEGPICKFYKGLYIYEWDGCDFFSPQNETFPFITKRAADILKKNKLTNVRLTNLADFEINVDTVKIKPNNQ